METLPKVLIFTPHFYDTIMKLKGIYAGYPTLFQLALLIGFALAGAILAGVIMFVFDPAGAVQGPGMLRFSQAVSAICMFLAPALLVALLCSNEPVGYLFIERLPGIKTALLTFAGVLLLSPAITLSGFLNKFIIDNSIGLPPFLQQLEEEIEQLMDLLLSDTGIVAVLLNLFVIAFLAALTEELFFRGILLRIVGKWIKNHHAVIWSVAFIFSVVHMQFYGLIPRMLLGAYLGYLLYWSKNIWVPVVAHFCNNAVAVIGMANGNLKENSYISGEIPEAEMAGFVITVIITFILFCYVTRRLRKRFLRD
jgi:membrane protease YdiL (CAAX protease family)